jgi:hypothetical protein
VSLEHRHSHLTKLLPWAILFLLFPQQRLTRIKKYVLRYKGMLWRLFDLESKLHNEDILKPTALSSEHCEVSLRQTLIKFLDAIDYSFTSYPDFKELELAVRNEILSFGIDLRPRWETRLRTSCALVGMAYIGHPIEIQFSIAVRNPSSFSYMAALIHSGA